jgi:hypothetical protein
MNFSHNFLFKVIRIKLRCIHSFHLVCLVIMKPFSRAPAFRSNTVTILGKEYWDTMFPRNVGVILSRPLETWDYRTPVGVAMVETWAARQTTRIPECHVAQCQFLEQETHTRLSGTEQRPYGEKPAPNGLTYTRHLSQTQRDVSYSKALTPVLTSGDLQIQYETK